MVDKKMNRIYLDSSLTDDELLEIQTIEQKLALAEDTIQNRKFTDEDKSKQINVYQAALNLMSETTVQRKRWFDGVIKKYTLPNTIIIDITDGRFYTEKEEAESN